MYKSSGEGEGTKFLSCRMQLEGSRQRDRKKEIITAAKIVRNNRQVMRRKLVDTAVVVVATVSMTTVAWRKR